MPPGFQIVQAIEHDVEAFEEVDAEVLLFDVCLPTGLKVLN